MSIERTERELRGANPMPKHDLEALDLAAGEVALGEALVAEPALAGEPIPFDLAPRRPRGPLLLLAGGCAAVAAIAIVLLLAGSASRSAPPAYGAELVRFAESTPLLLLESPGWRVQNVTQFKGRHGEGMQGSMEFVTGKPIPYESVRITCVREVMSPNGKYPICKDQRESGMLPASVRQRRVELSWRHGSLKGAISVVRGAPHPHGQRWRKMAVLDTTAEVDTRAEFYVNQGGPGNRQMVALWKEGGYQLEMRAAVPDDEAFEERLDWLTKVDSETWLDAMPAKVVKAADHDAAVREMLKGIPVPDGFEPSRVPDEGLTTTRYQVGAAVTGIVSCLWLRQWGEARESGDRAREAEAERAMATSRHWPILREMNKDGDYPEVVWEIAAAMPKGYWEWAGHRRRLLPHAEGLGCALWGLPLMERKQRLQRERRQQGS